MSLSKYRLYTVTGDKIYIQLHKFNTKKSKKEHQNKEKKKQLSNKRILSHKCDALSKIEGEVKECK